MKNSFDYFKILDELGDGVICINSEDSIVYINKKAKDILGYDYLNTPPKKILEIFHIKTEVNSQITMKIIEEVRVTGFARGLDYGSYLYDVFNDKRYISASVSLIEIDNENHVVISFRDISILKKLELENHEQKKNLESIYNSIPVGIVIVDKNRRVLQTNPFLRKIFNVDESTRKDIFLGEVLKCSNSINDMCGHGSDCQGCVLKASIDRLNEKKEEYVITKTKIKHNINDDYSYRDYQVSFVKILKKNQNRTLLLIQDITEQVEYEREIKKARECAEESNRLKSEFLSNFSHEIRTPLNGIIGMIDISKRGITDNETIENLEMAKESSLRLLKTINSVMEISTIENKKLNLKEKPFDLNKMFNEIYEKNLHKIEHGKVKLIHEKAVYKTKYIGDVSRIKKLINYLLDNAIKFTESGTISIVHEIKEINREEYLEVHIIDTGIGINSENDRKIFESFTQIDGTYTRNNEGNGLGLTISNKIVEMLGGKLEYKSELGEGSDFYFCIPLKKHSAKKYIMEVVYAENVSC